MLSVAIPRHFHDNHQLTWGSTFIWRSEEFLPTAVSRTLCRGLAVGLAAAVFSRLFPSAFVSSVVPRAIRHRPR